MSKTEQTLLELHTLTGGSGHQPTDDDRAKIASFLMTIEPKELKPDLASQLTDLLDFVASYSTKETALQVFEGMLSRFPAHVLSPAHAYFARQCCVTRNYEATMDLAFRSIEGIPRDYGLTYQAHLQYHFYLGLCCAALQHYERARFLFSLVVSAPTGFPGSRTSAIQVAAYKKYLLVGLVQDGQLPPMPSMTAGNTQRALEILGNAYHQLGRALQEATGSSKAVSAVVEQHASQFEQDGNTSLVESVVFCKPAHDILKVQKAYVSLSIEALASKIDQTTEKTLSMLAWMQSSGRLQYDCDSNNVTFLPLVSEASHLAQIQELVLSVKLLTDKVQEKQQQLQLEGKGHHKLKRTAGHKAGMHANPVDPTSGAETGVRQAASAVRELQMNA
jgi:tetratricopeptide (TPR) repeat protein